ncbi:MAG: hypothetical protein NZT61_02650 [Deltaproteobacteria bacterium]|nr:hypothetical protein [Deltaproteobacteria bacterium]
MLVAIGATFLARFVVTSILSFYGYLEAETRALRNSFDTFSVLESRKVFLETVKKSLEDTYKNFIWFNPEVGELSKFEEIKTKVSKDGLSIDQFRVETVLTGKFSEALAKTVFRISFQANKLSAVNQYLNHLLTGEFKALPLKVRIDKKASNDGLIVTLEVLILKSKEQ